MARHQEIRDFPRRLLYRWFVEYNPLYFFSALCVLAGVLLVSRALPEAGLEGGRLILAGVVQLYELLLIGAAALLFRVAGQRRPAVMLAIVAIPFLFDWTFQTCSSPDRSDQKYTHLPSLEKVGTASNAGWLVSRLGWPPTERWG